MEISNAYTFSHLRPKTLEGIKSLAKQIKKAFHIPHHDALDQASRQAGYDNYAHAHRKLQGDRS